MTLLKNFGEGLMRLRKSNGQTQEDFSNVSSRTYMSSLERGIKAPTITKIEQISSVLDVHPVSLLAIAYCKSSDDLEALCIQISAEIGKVLLSGFDQKNDES
jgi:transcriptional regulator with XRE-family HTH domain